MNFKKQASLVIYALCFAILGIGIYALYQAKNLYAKIDDLNGSRIPSLVRMADVDMMHDNIKANVYAAHYFALSNDKPALQTAMTENIEATERMKNDFASIMKLNISANIKKNINESKIEVEAYEQTSNKIIKLLVDGRKAEAIKLMPEFDQAFENLEKKLGDVGDYIKHDAGVSVANADSVLFFLFGTVAVVFLCGFFMGRNLLSKLSHTVKKNFDKLQEASYAVKDISNKLTLANEKLASGSTESASSLEETVASLEELSSMVSLNSEHSNKAYQFSEEAKKATVSGNQSVRQLMEAISQLKNESKKMEEIINVIDDISFQTNLLALNAAVEAARAGEQGKGFAVVADAVRNLAQKSSTSANEIRDLIKDNIDKIDRSYENAGTCNSAMTTVYDKINRITEINGQIAQASQEQSSGLKQINAAMSQLDAASQDNAATAEDVAKSAVESNRYADSLIDSLEETQHWMLGRSGDKGKANAAQPEQAAKHNVLKMRTKLDLGPMPQDGEIKKIENF